MLNVLDNELTFTVDEYKYDPINKCRIQQPW
jgi:hypothetical protein